MPGEISNVTVENGNATLLNGGNGTLVRTKLTIIGGWAPLPTVGAEYRISFNTQAPVLSVVPRAKCKEASGSTAVFSV